MLLDLLNKALLLVMVLSSLNIVRHLYYFIQAWAKSNNENPQKYILDRRSLILLGLSIGYVIMAIIDGLTLT